MRKHAFDKRTFQWCMILSRKLGTAVNMLFLLLNGGNILNIVEEATGIQTIASFQKVVIAE